MDKMYIKKNIIFVIAFQETYTIGKEGNKKPREPENKRGESFYRPYKKSGKR